MPFKSRVLRSLPICVVCLVLSALSAEVLGQQRVFAKVEPNADSIASSAETYEAASGTFTPSAGVMGVERLAPTASLLKDGKVLVAGGYNGASLSSADVYDPGSRLFTNTSGGMYEARSRHSATVLTSGKVLIVGGLNGSTYSATAELYDPSTTTFSVASASLTSSRARHTATLLSDGKVLIAGGYDGANYLQSAELYDPAAGTFTSTSGGLSAGRRDHTATLLPDGKVLIAGGENANGYLNTAEVYDPGTGKFTATSGTMSAARHGHTATLLSNGKVLVAGGYNGSYLNTAEIYDPATGRFAATSGSMAAQRDGHAAALLLGGKVLISGGFNGAYLKSAELFDPAAGTFTAVPGLMSVARQLHTATLLSDGRVLLAGGQNAALLTFDVNVDQSDNISPNIIFTADSKVGYVAYTGSGVVVAFSAETGKILQRIVTGGHPAFATPLPDGKTLAIVSVLDNKIFLIDMAAAKLQTTYTFANAQFGFGSPLSISADGRTGYISSTGTGHVIKFNLSDGKESGRLSGLQTPTQITLSKDGAILIVVDTSTEELDFVDTSSMTQKYALKAKNSVATADFTIFNKAVLAPDGTTGIIACRDAGGSLVNGKAFIFKTSNGEILDTESVGSLPGYTGVTPNGQNWVILNETSISIIPVTDPRAIQNIDTAQGDPLGSANVAFSPDSKYAYYASSAKDFVYQHDLSSLGVIGQLQVGDNPNKSLEQPSSVAVAPDGRTVAVLEFISNDIDLLTQATVMEAAKFIISGSQFSGISLVNLSAQPTTFTLQALDNYGQLISGTGVTNPVYLDAGPNAQISRNIAEIFNFDLTTDHIGRLSVQADQPQVTAYLTIGQIAATWFGYYFNKLDGVPLFRQDQQVHDFILPEIGANAGETVQLNNVNSNFTQQTYDLKHFAKDGTLLEEKTGNIAYPTNRLEQAYTDLFTAPGQDKVLITGGNTSTTTNSSAEAYDVTARTFSSTGAMTTARQGHSSTLLYNGKVLVAGGKNGSTVLTSAEIYDPSTGAFAATPGGMVNDRYRHSATLLQSGKVLMAGGQSSAAINSTAETYDPATNTFTATTGSMTVGRDAHTATLLPTGKVLIAGGINGDVVTDSAELYDPATGQFTSAGTMTASRAFHTATLLSNGRVLIAGGYNGSYLNSAEIYDPATGTFKATTGTMIARRDLHTATLIADGRVLLAGGTDGSATFDTLEIYDPSNNSFTAVSGRMASVRQAHTATLLSNGKVLFAGGTSGSADLNTAETFDPATLGFESAAGTMSVARNGHSATSLQLGSQGYLRVICKKGLVFSEIFGGSRDGGILNGIEIQRYAGITKLYSPQFANMPEFRTTLNLVNPNADQDAIVTVILHAPDGRVLGNSIPLTIPRNGKLQNGISGIFGENASIQNASGWLEVNSSIDRVLGTVTFEDDDRKFLTSLELSGTPLNNFVIPIVAEDGNYRTATALLNANDSTAKVTLELWGDGSLVRSASFTLAPGARTALYLSNYFSGLNPILVGNIRIRSDQPLHGFALIHDRMLHFMAGVPAVSYPEGR